MIRTVPESLRGEASIAEHVSDERLCHPRMARGRLLQVRRTLLTTVALTCIALGAHAFLADNGLRVRRTGEASFDVPYRGLSGERHFFWCAASDYGISKLNMSPATRMYRSSSPWLAGKANSLSLTPQGAKRTGVAVFGDPRSISASHAAQFLRDQTDTRRQLQLN